ncbi:hypothetical protein KR018_012076, partial [Drosophila ironensis]
NCQQCNKPVYKMEEVILKLKTETAIFHKTCLRCHECLKQLKPESIQIHDVYLYCTLHFKLIFAPKIVHQEDTPRKPELIIRENNPIELPSDVARASDKPNLGLEELHHLNVRSKFKVFENAFKHKNEDSDECQESAILNDKSILSTLNKLHKRGLPRAEFKSLNEGEDNLNSEINENDNESDMAFMRSIKEVERETPIGLGEAMNDIRKRFEHGQIPTKEERREERKQEIQNIRSRLFMGKQAKIKEMYQTAVAESKQGVPSVAKISSEEMGVATRYIKEKFENGDLFKENKRAFKDENSPVLPDADVFESGISKASRNIFMELDSNNDSISVNQLIQNTRPEKTSKHAKVGQENADIDVIKYDSKPEDVKITTSVLTERFTFFEKYREADKEKQEFRITPPRDGVLKMPIQDSDSTYIEPKLQLFSDTILRDTQTASTILNKFRELEEKKNLTLTEERKPKPLKCFTPPPEVENGSNTSDTDEHDSDDEHISNEYDMSFEEDQTKSIIEDQSLKDARNAARAKQLRAKFEKWQISEMEREVNEGRVDVFSQLISNDSIESAR